MTVVYVVQLASRVAEEKGSILGEAVGYSIRFDDCWTPGKTCIKVIFFRFYLEVWCYKIVISRIIVVYD